MAEQDGEFAPVVSSSTAGRGGGWQEGRDRANPSTIRIPVIIPCLDTDPVPWITNNHHPAIGMDGRGHHFFMKTENNLQFQHKQMSPSTCKVHWGPNQPRKKCFCLERSTRKKWGALGLVSLPHVFPHTRCMLQQCNCTYSQKPALWSYNLPAHKAGPRQPAYILTTS